MIIGVYSQETNNYFIAPSWRIVREFVREYGIPGKLYRCHKRDMSYLFKKLGLSRRIQYDWVTMSFGMKYTIFHMSAPAETFSHRYKCEDCGEEGTWTQTVEHRDDDWEFAEADCHICHGYLVKL